VDADDLTVFANNFGKGVGAPLAASAAKDEVLRTKDEVGGMRKDEVQSTKNEAGASVVISLREMEHASSRPGAPGRRLHPFGEVAGAIGAHSKRSFGVVGSHASFDPAIGSDAQARREALDAERGNQESQEENDALVELLARTIAADSVAAVNDGLADERLATSRRMRIADPLFSNKLLSLAR
jgi:hypothetical protein